MALAVAAVGLFDQLARVIAPSHLSNECDAVSLRNAFTTLYLDTIAKRVERDALRMRMAAREAAFERLRAEPYVTRGTQFEFARRMVEDAGSPGLKRSTQPARRPGRTRRRGRGK
jgi:hypothetical protein